MAKFYPLSIVSFFLVLAVPLFAESPYVMSAPQSVLSIRVVDKLVLAEAEIDGRCGFFMLDTGIGALTLNSRYFSNEDDLPKFRKVTDVNGSREKIDGGLVGSFRWGALQRDSFHVALIDMEGLEGILDCELLGLLGWEVFRDLEVMIDYDQQILTLNRLNGEGETLGIPGGPAPHHLLEFKWSHHLPVINARIGEQDLRLGWDTGASINLLNKKMRRFLPSDARRLMRIPYGGVFSDNRAPFLAVDAIYIDEQFAVLGWRMAAVNMRHFLKKEMEIDGLIGADLFRLGRVAINFRKQNIAIWINDNLFSQRYQLVEGGGLARGTEK